MSFLSLSAIIIFDKLTSASGTFSPEYIQHGTLTRGNLIRCRGHQDNNARFLIKLGQKPCRTGGRAHLGHLQAAHGKLYTPDGDTVFEIDPEGIFLTRR